MLEVWVIWKRQKEQVLKDDVGSRLACEREASAKRRGVKARSEWLHRRARSKREGA